LFGPAELKRLPDQETLPVLLRDQYRTRAFDVQEAERFTLLQTRFLDKPHLRQWAIRPLEKAGELEVVESSRRRASDYPAGTRMRFTR